MSEVIKVQVDYNIGETVYLPTDAHQSRYIVLGYNVRHNEVLYEIYNHNNGAYVAYGFELTREKELQL